MHKFKQGDRVAVYTSNGRAIGTVVQVKDDELMLNLDHYYGHAWCHPKQCRKLKKKVKNA